MTTTDPWRNYRIAVAILSAIVGVLAGYVMYGIQLVFEFIRTILELLTMQNMGGSGPSMSTDPTALTISIGVIGFIIFGGAGFLYARNGSNGRVPVWIAAILSLPVGAFSIWVLVETAPGKNGVPPNKRTIMSFTAGIALIAALLIAPTAFTTINQYIETHMRQDSEFIQHIDLGNVDALRALLEQGADPNQTTKLGTTALMYALEPWTVTSSEVAALLLDFGADPNTASRWQEDAEYEVYANGKKHEEGVRLDRSVNFTRLKESYFEHTPLVIVSRRGQADLVELMIEKGAEINAFQANRDVVTPLTTLMLEKGQSHGYLLFEHRESSALTAAIFAREWEVARVLLGHGATAHSSILRVIERGGFPYTGKMTTTYDSGQKQVELAYLNGKANGVVTYWHENGEVRNVVCFQNDEKVSMENCQ